MNNFSIFGSWFEFIFYFCGLNGCLALLEIGFFSRFIKQKLDWYYYLLYLVIMYFIYAVEIQLKVPFTVATVLETVLLMGFGYLVLKCPPVISAVTTVLTITIMQVVNGIFQSLSSILCTHASHNGKVVAVILIINSLLAMVAVLLTYKYVLKYFYIKNTLINRYILILLLPVLFILLVVQHIFMNYGNMVILNSNGERIFPEINDLEMLLIQIAAFFCLMAVLFAYGKLCEGFELKIQNALLEQQLGMQENYRQEMQTRYEQTRSFRHDLKNHWMVMKGLIKTGEIEKAWEYLNKLEIASDLFSYPCQTGNPIIDMLLSNKLGGAVQSGIQADCDVKIPPGGKIDEMDLSVVFSNAVDNAIKACHSMNESSEKYIALSAAQKGSFFMIEVENSQNKEDGFPKGSGIGLKNIKAVAEKYNGTISVEDNFESFKLNVLFIIPQHWDNISQQTH